MQKPSKNEQLTPAEMITRQGFFVLFEVLSRDELKEARVLIDNSKKTKPSRHHLDATAHPACQRHVLHRSPGLRALARCVRRRIAARTGLIPERARITRDLLFDKRPGDNWWVAPHQDRVIAFRRTFESPEATAWSRKSGIPHALGSARLLALILTVRLHLDDTDAGNGALLVAPGSHRYGILDPAGLAELRPEHTIAVPAGAALLMSPRLVHASRCSADPRPRRILHLELAAEPAPAPLEFHDALAPRDLVEA